MGKKITTFALAATMLAGTVSTGAEARTKDDASQRPNILLIVADDLGWSDLGAFGGEVDTPNLDKLALAGVRFTGFHTAPTCSPTRAMLMSGVDNHQSGLGTMAEMLTPAERGRPGYEGYLNDRVASVAEVLRGGGYRTLMAGKWHLGLTEERSPAARGFDRSFALLQGLGNYFGADQNDAWGKVQRASYREGLQSVPYPEGRYSTDLFADKLIGYLKDTRGQKKPFFAYLAFSAPHWPLMAPDADIAKYKGRYDAGYDVLREQRLARQKALGLIPADARPHPLVGAKPWAELTAAERADQARRMEVYAAMVDRLDRNVGRVLDQLRKTGELDNTLILFTSDNGPEGNVINAPTGGVANHPPEVIAALGIDNSVTNIGRGNSYVGYGPGWAQANSTPSWLVKGYTTEGGIRAVAFASGKGVTGGRISNALLHITDFAPTIAEEAAVTQPTEVAGHSVLPYQGKSLVPLLNASVESVRTDAETVSWELFYGRAIRRGSWKAVWLSLLRSRYLRSQSEAGRWQLFDLSRDPGETTDLASAQPDVLRQLTDSWNRYAAEKGVALPAAATAAATGQP